MIGGTVRYSFFFFNDTATTEIYTLSLHDALPIFEDAAPEILRRIEQDGRNERDRKPCASKEFGEHQVRQRSEEHTSELQSRQYLVCRLLLEKKKQIPIMHPSDSKK